MQISGSSAVVVGGAGGLAGAECLGPLRLPVGARGGPASGGRLVGKDGSPLDLDGVKTTIDVYLTGVFNVLRLAAAAIARQEPVDGARGVIITPHRSRPAKARSANCPGPPPLSRPRTCGWPHIR